MWLVNCDMLCVMCDMWHVMCYMLCVTCYGWCVMHDVLHVTCNIYHVASKPIEICFVLLLRNEFGKSGLDETRSEFPKFVTENGCWCWIFHNKFGKSGHYQGFPNLLRKMASRCWVFRNKFWWRTWGPIGLLVSQTASVVNSYRSLCLVPVICHVIFRWLVGSSTAAADQISVTDTADSRNTNLSNPTSRFRRGI